MGWGIQIRGPVMNCRAKSKEQEVMPGNKVSWFGWKIAGSVLFDQADWPFTEPWVACIDVPDNNFSADYTAKDPGTGVLAEFAYTVDCVACPDNVEVLPGPGGAKIIIDG